MAAPAAGDKGPAGPGNGNLRKEALFGGTLYLQDVPGPGRYPSKGTFGQFENALKGPKSKGFSFTKKPFPPRMEDSKPLELKIPRDFDTDGKKGFVGLKQSFVFTGKPRDKQMEADTRNYFKDPNSLSTMDPKKTKKGFSFSSRHRVPRGDDEYADPTKQKDFDPMLSFMRVHSKAVKGKKGECFGRSAVMLFRHPRPPPLDERKALELARKPTGPKVQYGIAHSFGNRLHEKRYDDSPGPCPAGREPFKFEEERRKKQGFSFGKVLLPQISTHVTSNMAKNLILKGCAD